jgi:uncharacterized protein YcfL
MKKLIFSMLVITAIGLASCSSENKNNDGNDTIDTSMNSNSAVDTTMMDTTTTDTTTMPQ